MDRKQCEHWFWFSRVQSSGLWGAKYSPLTSIILLYQEECVLKNVPHKWDQGCSHCSEHGNRGVRREWKASSISLSCTWIPLTSLFIYGKSEFWGEGMGRRRFGKWPRDPGEQREEGGGEIATSPISETDSQCQKALCKPPGTSISFLLPHPQSQLGLEIQQSS